MENTYSITVTNKFSLALDEDEDPLEILKLREQEREAKKKEKLNEKERAKQQQEQQPHKKQQSEASNKPKPRANKENQQIQTQTQQQQQQQQEQKQQPQAHQRNQDAKKDQGEKKLNQTKFGGAERDRNVKFESREEHNNRRNREDGDRPPRAQNDFKRGPPGEVRESRGDNQRGDQQPYREFRNSDYGTGERRGGRGGGRGMGRGGRGGGGFREGRGGGGRGGGYDNRDKREHDRRSGSDKTGIKPIDKRDGAGSHNWGTHNDEIEESLNTSDDWNNEQQPESTPATGANDSAENPGAEPTTEGGAATEDKPAEEEARELTLDEWKALRQNRSKPQYNLRKAGEGEDPSRWKKMYALEKKKEEAEEGEEDEEFDVAAEYPQRVGRQKHLFNIEINFGDSRRSTGGRGGRGGRGRGGDRGGGDRGDRGDRGERGERGERGDRGGGRGFNRGPPRGSDDFRNNEQRSPRERQNAPKVDDEHDFPSLG